MRRSLNGDPKSKGLSALTANVVTPSIFLTVSSSQLPPNALPIAA